MVVTRSISGATKKADTKVAVNHKVAERARKKTTAVRERASKKTSAKGERARKKLTTAEKESRQERLKKKILYSDAFEHFLCDTYFPQYYAKHPDVKVCAGKNEEVSKYGYAKWNSMTESDKAPYVAKVKKKEDEWNAAAEDFIKNRHLY